MVVNGVPSIGQQVMIGSGTIGTQTVSAAAALPPSSGYTVGVVTATAGATGSSSNVAATTAASKKSAASSSMDVARTLAVGAGSALLALALL